MQMGRGGGGGDRASCGGESPVYDVVNKAGMCGTNVMLCVMSTAPACFTSSFVKSEPQWLRHELR